MKYLFFCLITVAFLSCNSSTETNATNDKTGKGEQLFTTNCSTCHKPDVDFVGPALKGAQSRWADKTLNDCRELCTK